MVSLNPKTPRSGWTRAFQNPYTMAGRVPIVDTIIRDDTRVLSCIPAQLPIMSVMYVISTPHNVSYYESCMTQI
jgi:hypothetical protein